MDHGVARRSGGAFDDKNEHATLASSLERTEYFSSSPSAFDDVMSSDSGGTSSYCLDYQGCDDQTSMESLISDVLDDAEAWESLVAKESWSVTGPQTAEDGMIWEACRYYDVGDVSGGISQAISVAQSGGR